MVINGIGKNRKSINKYRNKKGEDQMKTRKVTALVLACAMLMGQTVWAQEETDETQVQENQEVQENIISSDSEQVEKEGMNTPESEISLPGKDTVVEEANEVSEPADVLEEEEKKIAEKSVDSEDEGIVETDLKTICVDYPIMVEADYELWDGSSFELISTDETICTVEGYTYEQNGAERIYFILTGKQEGEVSVNLKIDDNVVKRYDVTVNPLPDDAVIFQDIVLRTKICDDWYNDVNHDGCISKSELASMEVLDLSGNTYGMFCDKSIQDLSGLENATNMTYLYLDGNSKLSNIDILFEMKSLKELNLRGTSVSTEDRWKLADFHDVNLTKAENINLPSLGNIFEEGLAVEITEGEDIVTITESDNAYQLVAKSEGKVKLNISYMNQSAEITITIDGIPANQEVGKDYDVKVTEQDNRMEHSAYPGKSIILDSNNQLWQTYPTGEKLKDNVKEYVACWVYYGEYNECEGFTYLLDTDDVLWNGTQKLADDVVKFDGRYALNSKGVLTNFYNAGSEQIEQVEDWNSPGIGGKGKAYLLKMDGTLWTRQEVAEDQTLQEWEQIAENVKQIMEFGYLKNDGKVYGYDGTESGFFPEDAKVSEVLSSSSYYDLERNFYCSYYYDDWDEETGESIDLYGYANMGKIEVEKCIWTNGATYVLTKDNKVYKYDAITGTNKLYLEDVAQVQSYGFYSPEENGWTFQLKDGTYCDSTGEPMTEVIVEDVWPYQLIRHEDGSQVVVKNGIDILNCVTDIWGDYGEEVNYFALRTDGSIWNITGVPEKVLELNQQIYISGDANGDNAIDLKDLMLCLNHVSKKSTLTGDAFKAADVDGNGIVELKDLMRILNYVSKKSTEL